MKKLITILFILSILTVKASDTTYIIPIKDTSCVVKNMELSQNNRKLKTRNIVTTFIGGGALVGDIVLLVTLFRQ